MHCRRQICPLIGATASTARSTSSIVAPPVEDTKDGKKRDKDKKDEKSRKPEPEKDRGKEERGKDESEKPRDRKEP